MKNLFFAIVVLFSIHISAQEKIKNTDIFVRVYDLENNLISKGKILSFTDTSLQLKGKMDILANNIGFIKVRRSGGHNVFIGAVCGAAALGMYGVSTGVPREELGWFDYTVSEGAIAGALIGAVAGTAIGGITALFKEKSKIIIINGDDAKWKDFRNIITESKQ